VDAVEWILMNDDDDNDYRASEMKKRRVLFTTAPNSEEITYIERESIKTKCSVCVPNKTIREIGMSFFNVRFMAYKIINGR
jgi:hypothetical protein